jgi:predicted dithiol-disulfide oxidoreductase (DUF899 family)
MTLPSVATQEEWLAEREALRGEEERLARTREAVIAARRALPMAEFDAGHTFEGPHGQVTLPDLFEGRGQLLVYHFWFEPGEEPCKGCSLWVSDLGDVANLHARDTSLVLVSRAPVAEIEAVRERRGLRVPWYSMAGEDFNAATGYVGAAQISVFVRDGDSVYRTYVTHGRRAPRDARQPLDAARADAERRRVGGAAGAPLGADGHVVRGQVLEVLGATVDNRRPPAIGRDLDLDDAQLQLVVQHRRKDRHRPRRRRAAVRRRRRRRGRPQHGLQRRVPRGRRGDRGLRRPPDARAGGCAPGPPDVRPCRGTAAR